MKVLTKKAVILKNVKKMVVQHTYILDIDKRRHTDYYICGNEKSAKTLIMALTN